MVRMPDSVSRVHVRLSPQVPDWAKIVPTLAARARKRVRRCCFIVVLC